MAHRLLRDEKEEGWETSEFPIVCETCLGPNPYVRMQKIPYGGQCHISGRPYTVFRWRPGVEARYKKTIICQEVAKAKNVCQVCLFDLEYGLPVEVRDRALAMSGQATTELAQSDVGREYQLKQMEQDGTLDSNESTFKARGPGHDLLMKLARTAPYYRRNQARICTFYVRGECKRGAECPYRHEMPTDPNDPLSRQNIKDRYFGVNDPVASKMLNRASNMKVVVPPADPTLTTLWVGGVEPEINEEDLRSAFYGYGEIRSIKIIPLKRIAFVEYVERSSAEAAAEALCNALIVKGTRLALNWAKPQGPPRWQPQPAQAGGEGSGMLDAAGPYSAGPPPGNVPYASMDPSQMGSGAAYPGGSNARQGGGQGYGGPPPYMGGYGAYPPGAYPPYPIQGMPLQPMMPQWGAPQMGVGHAAAGAPGPAAGDGAGPSGANAAAAAAPSAQAPAAEPPAAEAS